MKRSLPILLAILATLTPVTSYAAFSVNVDLVDADIGELLLLGAAALFFDLDTQVNLEYSNETQSATTSISLYYISGETQNTPEIIMADKKKLSGWGALAKGKIPPGLAKKWGLDPDFSAKDDSEIERQLTVYFLSSYYDIPQKDITLWIDKGLPLQDIAVCINLATKIQINPSTIIELRLKGQNWSQISTKYNLTLEDLKEPVNTKKKHDKKLPKKSK